MSEPWVPEPPPEKDGYHDPHPPRCPVCRAILRMTAYSHEGYCPRCKEIVLASYSFSEDEEWEGRERRET